MRSLHGWLALVFALPLLLVSLSGAMLGFARESDRIAHVDLLGAPFSTAPSRPLEGLLDTARAAYPAWRVIGLGLPVTPVDAVLVVMEDNAGERQEVYLHPRTGELRGARSSAENLYGLAWRLHTTLLLDETGRWITRLAAVGLLMVILSGLRLRRYRAADGGSARTHSLLGLTTTPVLALVASSGLLFLTWQPGFGHAQHQALHAPSPKLELPSPSAALTDLHTAQPECVPRWVAPFPPQGIRLACEMPHHAGTLGHRWFTWTTTQGLLPDEGVPSAGELLYNAHTGELLGMPGRILWVMASLAVPLLLLGGMASHRTRLKQAHHDE